PVLGRRDDRDARHVRPPHRVRGAGPHPAGAPDLRDDAARGGGPLLRAEPEAARSPSAAPLARGAEEARRAAPRLGRVAPRRCGHAAPLRRAARDVRGLRRVALAAPPDAAAALDPAGSRPRELERDRVRAMSADDRSLELQGDPLRRLIEAATERILSHIESLPRQPSADVEGGIALARSLVETMPETGTPVAELLDLLFDTVVPKTFNTAGPGYLAYIPGGGIPHAAVADLIADSVNRYVGVFAAAPGLAQLEENVVRWFC